MERCTPFVHGRCRMTIDPSIPTLPGRSTSGFRQPGRHCMHQARSAVRCPASRMKGETASFREPHVRRTSAPFAYFLLMDDSANDLLCFLVRPLLRLQFVSLCISLVGGWGGGNSRDSLFSMFKGDGIERITSCFFSPCPHLGFLLILQVLR